MLPLKSLLTGFISCPLVKSLNRLNVVLREHFGVQNCQPLKTHVLVDLHKQLSLLMLRVSTNLSLFYCDAA